MASKFADTVVRDLNLKDRMFETQAKTRLDIELLKVSEALGHARYRNHDHNPGACNACEQLEQVVADLKIRP